MEINLKKNIINREQARGQLGRSSLPTGTNFSLFSAEGEVKMYRSYRHLHSGQKLLPSFQGNSNFSLKFWASLNPDKHVDQVDRVPAFLQNFNSVETEVNT